MKKSIVIYDSCSGNTKKVANEIAVGLKCNSVFIDEINEYKLDDYDLIVIGAPVHAYGPTKKIKQFVNDIKNPKYCAIFCTYGAPLLGSHSADKCLNYIEKKLKTKCIDKFKCLGFHHILKTYKDHPDEKDLINAKIFGEKLLNF